MVGKDTMKLRKEDRYCVDCGKKGVKERNRCEVCVKEHNKLRAKKRNEEFGRYHRKGICSYYGKEMKVWRENQVFHSKCFSLFKAETKSDNNKVAIGRYYARKIAISNGIMIVSKNCVHYIDENPTNNKLDNLIVMTIRDHSKLHNFLWRERSLWLKDQSKYSENCWKTLRVRLTTAWIEMSNAKVIKLSEIGQSAAEPLKSNKTMRKVQRPCTEVLSHDI